LIQTISSYENKLDGIEYVSSLPNYPSLSSDSLSIEQEGNGPECLSKNLFWNILHHRDRRASISRPYFHHWPGSRDGTRYLAKNLLTFSSRLGKRSYEDEHKLSDFDTFLAILVRQLQRKQIDIIYEDSTNICLSQAVSDAFIQEVIDKFNAYRRQQDI
jgi:hypothetical protein